MTTVRENLRVGAVTQYQYPTQFESFCVFQGVPLGAGPDGIFRLNGDLKDVMTTTSDERNISAWFELPSSQLGMPYVKQGRRLYLGGEFNGAMTVTIDTMGTSNTYTATPRNTTFAQHILEVPLKSTQKSEYWTVTVANVSGADFSLDLIDGVFVQVNRRLGI